MTVIEHYIQQHFHIPHTDELHHAARLFNYEVIKKGDHFLQQGQRCSDITFIHSGYFRIYAQSHRKEVTQWIASTGYFMTDIAAFYNQGASRWSIEALVDTELYTISFQDYQKLNDIITGWYQLERKFIIHCFATMEQRIFEFISMNAEERYHHFFSGNKELFQHVPLQHIASMLGMTPETLSRIRKK